MSVARTSGTSPLIIDAVPAGGAGGSIGMTFCPGKKDPHGRTGAWDRDLALDMERISAFGATVLLTLMEEHELDYLQTPASALRAAVESARIVWLHAPITDGGTPDAGFERWWNDAGADLRQRLSRGERIVVHCRGGLGRTGTIAARLLIELGAAPDEAIRAVRAARPGAIENATQEAYVRGCAHARP